MNKKDGFISMTLVYTFLIVFLFLMLAILRTYTEKDKFLEAINAQIDSDISVNKSSRSTLINKILEDNAPQDIASVRLFNIANNSSGNGNGLFYVENINITDENADNKSSRMYFYRGNVENNHIVVSNMCFRIIRTNENGSIRVRYNGIYKNNKCPTLNEVVSGSANVKVGNTSFSLNSVNYVELVGGKIPQASDGNLQSNVIKILNQWFYNNMYGTNAYEKIENDVIFCNNKEVIETISGTTRYKATQLIPKFKSQTNKDKYDNNAVMNTVSLNCTNANDRFNVFDNTLLYPVGLLSAQEIVLSGGYTTSTWDEYQGGAYPIENKDFYLYTGRDYWTMSPFIKNSNSYITYVNNNGTLSAGLYSSSYDVIPVVSLKADIEIDKGNGEYNNPYILK